MSALARGIPLICSALLGALVISCGGPPVNAGAPTSAVAVAPPLTPAVPPRRPGGAPPGTELVTLPGGQGPLKDWLSAMDKACADAHYQPGCLNLMKNFSPKNGPHSPSECRVDSQSPGIGRKVTTSTPITLNITCPDPKESGETGKKGKAGPDNETTTTGRQGP